MANASVAQLKHEGGRGLVIAARVGYAARGVVYTVLGVLALMFSLGEGGELTDNKGALEHIGSQPFGTALLWLTAFGLACYALWCAVRVVKDPDRVRRPEQSLVHRVGFVIATFWYGLLAIYAAQLAHGSAEQGGNTQNVVARVMGYPFGKFIIAVVGVGTLVFGLRQIWSAYKNKVGREFQGAVMDARQRRFAHHVARWGTLARGLVFPVIGVSLIVASMKGDPSEAEGFGDALRALAQKPYGDPLITFVSLGLLAYGLYQFCVARYGRLPEPR